MLDNINMEESEDSGNVIIRGNRIYFYDVVDSISLLKFTKLIHIADNHNISNYLKNTESWESFNKEKLSPIYLHINSLGGDLGAGLTMLDIIRNIKSPVYTIIDAWCCSAATLPLIVGDKRYMYENSNVLIHNLSYSNLGHMKKQEIDDMQKNSEKLSERVKKLYLEYTDMNEEYLENLLGHELYFNSEECLEQGIIDEIL